MAEEVKSDEPGGAPVPGNAVDPALIKLGRKRINIGVITAAGVLILCVYFVLKLGPDRHFAGAGDQPGSASASDVVAGKVGPDSYIALHGEPLLAASIRSSTQKGGTGLRVSPIRGTGDRVWLLQPGDAFGEPSPEAYVGRLRRLSDLPMAGSIREFAAEHPRPVFATSSAVVAGLASGKVASVSKDDVPLDDSTRVAFDVIDPDAAILVGTYNEHQNDLAAWTTALATAKITGTHDAVDEGDGVRFQVTLPDAVKTLTGKLETAELWASRVDPVTRHYETTWGELKKSPAGTFAVGKDSLPVARVDLVGFYVGHNVPDDAYVLLVGETPDDYWYVLPITIALALIGLVFLAALVRAVRRDFLGHL